MIKKDKSGFLYKSDKIKISGTANGCFAIIASTGECQLYNAKGELKVSASEVFDAMLLEDGYYFIRPLSSNKANAKNNAPFWNMYAPNGTLLHQNLINCEVYANNWYRIKKMLCHSLYRNDHSLVAQDFSDCAVFKNGYALRRNENFYKYPNWKVLSPDDELLGFTNNTAAILGDGFFLEINVLEKSYILYDPKNNEVMEKDIIAYESFPNKRFSLVILTSNGHKIYKMYNADGTKPSVNTYNAKFLPDGRFLTSVNRFFTTLYAQDGFIKESNLWDVEFAGNYYIIFNQDGCVLYNDKGEDLGSGYALFCWQNNFIIVENEDDSGTYHLFNQFGEVFTFPKC